MLLCVSPKNKQQDVTSEAINEKRGAEVQIKWIFLGVVWWEGERIVKVVGMERLSSVVQTTWFYYLFSVAEN